MDKLLQSVAHRVEKQLDMEIERIDNLDAEDINAIRKRRLEEMKLSEQRKKEWLNNGHGEYSEVCDEKEFFEVCKKSDNVVCQFYKPDSMMSKIMDMHLKLLAKKHVETKFVKINAEKAPFLSTRLKIRVIPTLAILKDNKTKDFIVGFSELGNREDFSTELLEWTLARSEVIEYTGDLAKPPTAQKHKYVRKDKAIRESGNTSDELSD